HPAPAAHSLESLPHDVAPTVTAQAPAPAPSCAPLHTTETPTLSLHVALATFTTATFRLRAAGSTADVPATVTVNAAGTLATLTPSSPLAGGTVYTATLIAAAAYPIGTPLDEHTSLSLPTHHAPTGTSQAPAPGAT